MRNAIPQGLTPDEARELQAGLAPEEWQALFAVQQTLSAVPAITPAEGFAPRTLARLTAREQERARRRSAVGALALVLGALLGGGFVLVTYGEAAWSQVGGPSGLVTGLIILVAYAQAYLAVLGGLAVALYRLVGNWPLFGLAAFAFGLALISALVIGSAPSSRPILEREA